MVLVVTAPIEPFAVELAPMPGGAVIECGGTVLIRRHASRSRRRIDMLVPVAAIAVEIVGMVREGAGRCTVERSRRPRLGGNHKRGESEKEPRACAWRCIRGTCVYLQTKSAPSSILTTK